MNKDFINKPKFLLYFIYFLNKFSLNVFWSEFLDSETGGVSNIDECSLKASSNKTGFMSMNGDFSLISWWFIN